MKYKLTWEVKQSGLVDNHWTSNTKTFESEDNLMNFVRLLLVQTKSIRNIYYRQIA